MKVKTYFFAEYDAWSKEFSFVAWPHENWKGKVLVHTAEVEIPDLDSKHLTNGLITAMKDEQQEIRAECEVNVQNIEQQIQEMLCIEDNTHSPAKEK